MAATTEKCVPVVTFVTDDSAYEPQIADIRTRTIRIKDGKGGQACFDISEVNDLVLLLASLTQTDAGKVTIIDLTKNTAV